MVAAMAGIKMIPPFIDTCGEAIRALPIREDGSALLAVPPAPYWQVRAVYAEQGIAGAMDTCYLREQVISRLARAARHIADTGLQLVILDGWRPPAVQQALYQAIFRQVCADHPGEDQAALHRRTREFVSPPSEEAHRPSPHLTGGSVDVTLSDGTGKLLDMGSAFDEPTPRSYSDAYEKLDSPIRERRRLLFSAMTTAGFTHLPSEWWHFDYGNQNWAYYSGQSHAIFGAIAPARQYGGLPAKPDRQAIE